MGGVFRGSCALSARLHGKVRQSWYAGDAVDTTVFVEKGGKTTVTITVLYQSKEVRDGVLKSPAASGLGKSYDKLDEVLASTKKRSVK